MAKQTKHFTHSFMVGLFVLFSLVNCSEESDSINPCIKVFQPQDTDFRAYADSHPDSDYYTLFTDAEGANWAGKSIAILGGSLASLDESNVTKKLYYQILHCSPITTYGHGGWGFATKNGSIQDILQDLQYHDIYILWCSTNDYGTGIPCGEPTDFSETDGLDFTKTSTQCGGINLTIKTIREINPNALIIGFTSLRFFGKNASREDGYLEDTTKNNGQGITFHEYVAKQIETFELAKIPYYDQYHCGLFTVDNYGDYYQEDGFHLTENGYFLLGCKQVQFFIDLIKQFQQ